MATIAVSSARWISAWRGGQAGGEVQLRELREEYPGGCEEVGGVSGEEVTENGNAGIGGQEIK